MGMNGLQDVVLGLDASAFIEKRYFVALEIIDAGYKSRCSIDEDISRARGLKLYDNTEMEITIVSIGIDTWAKDYRDIQHVLRIMNCQSLYWMLESMMTNHRANALFFTTSHPDTGPMGQTSSQLNPEHGSSFSSTLIFTHNS